MSSRVRARIFHSYSCGVAVTRAGYRSSEAARFRFGALRFTPSIALSNLGVDNNVFNEADNPKQDTTAAVGPAVNLWLNMGKSRLSGTLSGQYLYYKEYENQRAWNTVNDGQWELPLSRIKPYVNGAWSDVKDRPGYEIDARVRLKEQRAGVGLPACRARQNFAWAFSAASFITMTRIWSSATRSRGDSIGTRIPRSWI